MQPLFLPPSAVIVSEESYTNKNNYTAKYTTADHFSNCTSLMENEQTDIGYESQQSSKSNQSLKSAVDPYTYSQMLYQVQYETLQQQVKEISNGLKSNTYQTTFSKYCAMHMGYTIHT
eukprot:341853_1